jgi:hypothetical protein
LASAYSIIKRQGRLIAVEPEMDHGSIFSISLPSSDIVMENKQIEKGSGHGKRQGVGDG